VLGKVEKVQWEPLIFFCGEESGPWEPKLLVQLTFIYETRKTFGCYLLSL